MLDPTVLRSDSTGNSLYNPGTGTGVNDGDGGTDGLGSLRNRVSVGLKNLQASAPFQPGSEGRQFFANAMRMVPFAGAAYSGYAAATGKDPIAGTCEGIGPRILDGLSAAAGLHDIFLSHTDGGGVPTSGVRRINPWKIKFGQEGMDWRVRGGGNIGELANEVRNGRAALPPIEVIQNADGSLVTLDNRRLLIYRSAGVEVPYVIVDPLDPRIAKKIRNNIDIAGGHDNPYIRNVPNQ